MRRRKSALRKNSGLRPIRHNCFPAMIAISVAAILMFAGPAYAGITGTAHNLSIGTRDGCFTCHKPHSAAGKRLWPASMTAQEASYGTVGALCFYCHGTGGGAGLANAVQTHVMDVSGDAEFSHGRDKVDLPSPGDSLDSNLPYGGIASGSFECTTCHNVHDDTNMPFLQDDIDVLCARCHDNRQFVGGTAQAVQGDWGANYGSANDGSHPVGDDVYQDGGADSPIMIDAVFRTGYGATNGGHNLGGHLTDGETTAGAGSAGGITCVTCHAVHGLRADANPPVVDDGTPAVNDLLTIAQPTAGGAYLGGVYNGNGDARNALCEGCHYTTATTIDPSTGSNYGNAEKPNPGVEAYTHPCDDLGAQGPAGVAAFPANWPEGSTPGTNVSPGPICESCHTPHPNANVARSTIIDGSGSAILRAVDICAECHGGGSGRHHPAGVPMGALSDSAVENGDGTLNCNDCHGGAEQSAHNWTQEGSFNLDPDWEPNSTGGVVFSDNGQGDEGTNPNKRFVADSSKECMDCHLSAGPNPAPYGHHVTGSETEYGEYQDTGAASHYLGNTNGVVLDYANGNCPDGTTFNATTTDWPGGGWSRFDDNGTNQVVCESCHELESSKNVAGTALLLHKYVEGDTNDSSAGSGSFASELCEGCHGTSPGGKTHPLTGDTVDSTGALLDNTSNDPPAANPPSGNATYPANNAMNCDSCHQPHDADTDSGTYILEDNVTSTGAAGDTRGANIVDLTYHEFCRNCHTTF